MDVETVRGWLERLDYEVKDEGPKTLRVFPRRPGNESLPPYFIQCSEHWLLLSLLPVLSSRIQPSPELPRRLLLLNRDMRIAKFAQGGQGEVVLCAELPTESLDFPEFADATERLVKYFHHYHDYLASP
ncbi:MULTISPECIES: YbjN domain-containing protein [Polyangium]|uniref:YbjN domain-containing protein n=1 Tax=Polyangium jinanense TaxID=2829994 RepID=A0A9X3X282_9BACT|nr:MULTISPECIES: YbjN domain-containing protein [Polyangium]MDC3954565.1 YbjN domain-containing protein [Polyangium jinanense]MDC3980868.1 YbjN domain-containing protein [Polyangium jinanense]MDI1477065.1 YbjN domain-containing protein [Polyangium sp. y55x31]